jgi:hypothetical protein
MLKPIDELEEKMKTSKQNSIESEDEDDSYEKDLVNLFFTRLNYFLYYFD